LKKTWDNDKKIISVITCYPNFEGTKKLDLTTQLIMNKVVEMDEFGSIHFVNLYSNITTPINIKHLENSHDKHTDIQIMKAVKETWDNDKKIISVITCYPNFEGTKKLDLTTQLIMNKVVEMDEFGSIHFVNLYSNITTPINIKHLENSHDKHTDIQIMKAVKE